jgi:hypothetical protein
VCSDYFMFSPAGQGKKMLDTIVRAALAAVLLS